jgi:hypothetical protein
MKMVAKSAEEIQTMKDEIKAGILSPDAIEQYLDGERRNVFGFDSKTDARGQPIEQGIGAKGNETLNHFNAMLKAEQMGGVVPGTYKAAVAEIWKRDPRRAEKLGLPRL